MVRDCTQGLLESIRNNAFIHILIVEQGHVIEEGEELSSEYQRRFTTPDSLNLSDQRVFKDSIYMYDPGFGTAGQRPRWILGSYGERRLLVLLVFLNISLYCPGELLAGFQEVCTIEVDLSQMSGSLQKIRKPSRDCFSKGKSHWLLTYRIAFSFGSTELKAFVLWDDKVRINSVFH